MGLETHVIIKYYIRRVLATCYGKMNFIKRLKVSRATRARILKTKSIKKRRDHCSRKLEKGEEREKNFIFENPKNREDLIRCSMR